METTNILHYFPVWEEDSQMRGQENPHQSPQKRGNSPKKPHSQVRKSGFPKCTTLPFGAQSSLLIPKSPQRRKSSYLCNRFSGEIHLLVFWGEEKCCRELAYGELLGQGIIIEIRPISSIIQRLWQFFERGQKP